MTELLQNSFQGDDFQQLSFGVDVQTEKTESCLDMPEYLPLSPQFNGRLCVVSVLYMRRFSALAKAT